MCGICGIIHFDQRPVEAVYLQTMMNAIKHRGPDDEGLYRDQYIGLGHVRLSIIDLSEAGHQPMLSPDQRYVIVYNGEIYNYLELKQELASSYHFVTHTDTEVILAAYQHWGTECLHHFNGMFAFALYDTREKTLFIARDRFGIKPFYYYHDAQTFLFASDIPALLAVLPVPIEPDNQSIYDFLVFNRTNHTEQTFFQHIKKLQHAHSIIIKNAAVRMQRWYNLPEHLSLPFQSPDELREALHASIHLRLRSDVPVGACLSGGLDSSSIVSLILAHNDRPALQTFSAIYEKGMRGDESEFIEEYRPQVPDMHCVQPTADSLFQDLDRFITALVEPVPGTSEYAEFKVMELARNHVTVLLNGQGADEELAGYLYFSGFFYKELLSHGHIGTLLQELYYDVKHHQTLAGPAALLYFLLPTRLKNRVSVKRLPYLHPDFTRSQSGSDAILQTLYASNTLQQAFLHHFEHKFEHHLLWADRSAMSFSLESRFPFLDHRFVEKVLALPRHQVIHKGWTKWMLREAMTGIVPECIRWRKDKVGYATPEDSWLRSPEFIKLIQDLLHSAEFQSRGYIAAPKALTLYQQHMAGKIHIGQEIWKWLHLELWFRKYV